jgi:hypothetical protein
VTPGTGTPGPTADGERRGDLVHGYRTLTGTVARSGRWVLLDAGTRTWALLGVQADRFDAGARVTVAGAVAAVPKGCPADRALTVGTVR